MSHVDIHVKIIDLPEDIKGKDYLDDSSYRSKLKVWIHELWREKEKYLK